MEFIKLTSDKYKEWDDFCLKSDDAWFWHTSSWLEYMLEYKKQELKSESRSFMLINNGKIIAVCPLILETHSVSKRSEQNIKEFSSGGDYYGGVIPAFVNSLTAKEKQKAVKLVFRHIDQTAGDDNVSRVRFKFPNLNKSFIEKGEQKFNYLMKFGYLDTSLNTQIIDLRKSIEELNGEMRHGHSSDVKRAGKLLSVEIFDAENITAEVFNKYINLHYQAAGRVTRSKFTFDIMYSAIKQGSAFLSGAKKDNEFVGFAYFFVYKKNVFYASACNDPDLYLPISHIIQWETIKYMKKENYIFYEIGLQQYGTLPHDFVSEKQIRNAHFKRGFGGFTVPFFMAEKYYSQDYFLKKYKEGMEKYAGYIQGNYEK